jgi:hypothetical protein
MRSSTRRALIVTGALAAAFVRAGAQDVAPPDSAIQSPTQGVITVSGDSVDRLRMSSLEGRATTEGLMLRSPSSLMDPRRWSGTRRTFTIVFPQITFATNTTLPFGQNDGALWQGKGANVRALAGITASYGPVRVVLIPEIAYSANNRLNIDPADTRFWPAVPANRSRFSSPANVFPYSIDLPWRMGDASFTKIYPGQSSIYVGFGPIEIGAATENEWWGPALRNPLVMGDNAPGFPHAFLRAARPLDTFVGRLDFRWLVGGLHESDWFDNDFTNDVRSLSAFAFTWSPNARSGLTLGFTRSVFRAVDGYSGVAGRAFDFLSNVGHPDARSLSDSTMIPGDDQLLSFFARWAAPRYGLEAFAEWGRADMPTSLRDLFEQPDHSRGYTSGIQWARPVGVDGHVRVQGELTNVEQSSTYRFRPLGSWYTSRAVIQGYTNEGQIIGAGIGPGSSSQWAAVDFFTGPWQVGVNVGRTRFNNDAFFLLPYASRCGHDVTVYPGLRGAYANRYVRLRADFSAASRYNTFFQNKASCDPGGEGSDRSNKNLVVTLSTLGW